MGTDGFIKQLMDEREQKVTVINNLANVAADEGRDLNESDLATIDNYRSRIKNIDVQIDKVAGDLELADAVRGRVRQLDPALVAKDFTYRTAGEYLWDALNLRQDHTAQARWGKFHKRAAEHMGYDKDNTIAVAGGFNGLIVDPVVGAVLNPHPAGRPLFTALGVRPMEAGTFLRPRVVDPNFTTGVGPQGQEKSELPSKAWEIKSDQVVGEVIGGYINISELLTSFMPSALDMIVTQMNRRLEGYTETAAVTEMDKTTAELPLANTATSADVTKALGTASTMVFSATGNLPTWLAMGPIGWGRLIGMSDLAGRPMIPNVGPSNAWAAGGGTNEFFTSIGGLRAVVTPAITTAFMYVGNSFGLEVYERRLPILQAVEPSVFGRQLSVQSAIAFYRPITKEATATPTPEENNGVVRIEWAA